MNIGLLGGTFDPIHRGHLALARAAQQRCDLGRVLFIPANVPPHKQKQTMASYFHRYAMVVLATANEKQFVPSLLEAPEQLLAPAKGKSAEPRANYSIDTVRQLKRTLKKSDRLFFLIGMDAFADIAKWHEAEAMLRECDFIVASRPGYSLADVANALPERMRPRASITKPFAKQALTGHLAISGASLHLLENLHENVSATTIRQAVASKKPLTRFVEPAVAEYIKKMNLYR
jgi:nicotinate-nucleotide adenylyltransferase